MLVPKLLKLILQFTRVILIGLLPVQPWRIAISAMVVAGLSCCYLPTATSISELTIPHFGLGLGVGMLGTNLSTANLNQF